MRQVVFTCDACGVHAEVSDPDNVILVPPGWAHLCVTGPEYEVPPFALALDAMREEAARVGVQPTAVVEQLVEQLASLGQPQIRKMHLCGSCAGHTPWARAEEAAKAAAVRDLEVA